MPRKQSYIRKSGGLGFFVRQNLIKFVELVDTHSEYIAWIKISKHFHGLDKDILIGNVYIPPQDSRFFNDDEFEFFEQEIASACSRDDYIYILGDFNAQTGEIADFTSADNFLAEYFHFDEGTVEFFDQKCVLEKFQVQINRISMDKKKNNSGFRLIDISKNNNLFILNGRYGQDKNIGAMTFRSTSVIDYSLISAKTFEIVHDFKITDVDRLFSDGHSLLTVEIQVQNNRRDVHAQSTTSRAIFIKPTEFDTFISNFEKINVTEILERIQ